MNKPMNQTTQESLMKVVERAVRPLGAGKVRKLAMREELLPHLTALYSEEAARGADEQTALAAAADRFGDPQELSQELAGTLTWRDRWSWLHESWAAAIDQTFGWQNGEPFTRFAQRSGSVLAALNVLFFVFVFVVTRVANGQFDATFASFNRFTLALFAAMIASEVVVLWSSQLMVRALFPVGHPRRWLFAAASLVGWTALMIVLGCIFWYGITLDPAAVLAVLPRIALATALTLSPLVLLIAWAAAYERKVSEPYAQWSSIALDE